MLNFWTEKGSFCLSCKSFFFLKRERERERERERFAEMSRVNGNHDIILSLIAF